MQTQQWLLKPLFEQFIKDSYKGKRLKPDGKKIKVQTIDNYKYVLQHLIDFETNTQEQLRLKAIKGTNKKVMEVERKYWKKFYLQFTAFLYKEKGCYDNYAGSVIKTIKVFFNYLVKDRLLPVGDFYKQFYVIKEEIEIITLLPHQLQFLINDKDFHNTLSTTLQQSKMMFVLGCTVALRISDLAEIKIQDIERVGEGTYLSVTSLKSDTPTRIKLPTYAVSIVEDFIKAARKRKTVLPNISKNQFNKNIRQIAEKAGWDNQVRKVRSIQGRKIELYKNDRKNSYRFCDLLSSHTMRRTGITTMLMLGMPEHIVRKISGHAANSKTFYRYINLVQSYLDTETDKAFNKLVV